MIYSHLRYLDLLGRAEMIPDLYDLYDLYDLAHVAGLEPYNLIDLAHLSWVGSVLHRSCTASHRSRLGSVVGLDRDLSDLSDLSICPMCVDL